MSSSGCKSRLIKVEQIDFDEMLRRRNSVEPLVGAGDNDDTQRNTRRLLRVSLHPGTPPEQRLFLHFG
jgi:hypothetical protein